MTFFVFGTSDSKENHVNGLSLLLASSGINYVNNVSPGDWIILWAFDNYNDFERVYAHVENIVENQSFANTASGFNDGLKFVGKIASVSRTANSEPETGIRHVYFSITANGFKELDAEVFYNPQLAIKYPDTNSTLINVFGITQDALQQGKGHVTAETMVPLAIDTILGIGPQDTERQSLGPLAGNIPISSADIYAIPKTVLDLIRGPLPAYANKIGPTYSDLLSIGIGIQKYAVINTSSGSGPEAGFNSCFQKIKDGRYQAQSLSSQFLLLSVEFANTPVWGFINNFVNDTVEEIYTTLRVNQDGIILPTLTVRQKVFNTDNFVNNINTLFPGATATSFFEVPRWKIDRSQVMNEELTKSESQRKNFVFTFGQDPTASVQTGNLSDIMGRIPPVINKTDIRRNGLSLFYKQMPVRQVITDSGDVKNPSGAYWSLMLADMYMDGQQKLTGSILVKGIQAPICVGDNLEYDGNVFHIERVVHTGMIDSATNGMRSFNTLIQVSNGLSIAQDSTAASINFATLPRFAPSAEFSQNIKELPGELFNNSPSGKDF